MARISDNIEDFILSTLGSSPHVNLSRNDLAHYFNCAPSQINYVLTTRFNINRGFVIESQRGGGGYIRIVKLQPNNNNYLLHVVDNVLKSEISFRDATYLIGELVAKKVLSQSEATILVNAVSDRALANPIKMEDKLRSNILKHALIGLIKSKQDGN